MYTRNQLNQLKVLSYIAFGSSSKWSKIIPHMSVRVDDSEKTEQYRYVKTPQGTIIGYEKALNLGIVNSEVSREYKVYNTRPLNFEESMHYLVQTIDDMTVRKIISDNVSDPSRALLPVSIYRTLLQEYIPYQFKLVVSSDRKEEAERASERFGETSGIKELFISETEQFNGIKHDVFDFLQPILDIMDEDDGAEEKGKAAFRSLSESYHNTFLAARNAATKGRSAEWDATARLKLDSTMRTIQE